MEGRVRAGLVEGRAAGADPRTPQTAAPEAAVGVLPGFEPAMIRSAVISDDGLFRYRLDRHWVGDRHARILFILLNPSTADAEIDDPTLTRCVGFARREGYGGLTIVNLYALRCTRPVHLEDYPDPVGPDNMIHVARALQPDARDHGIAEAVVGWGAHATPRNVLPEHPGNVVGFLADQGIDLLCLGRNDDGSPRHPLYLAAETTLEPWD